MNIQEKINKWTEAQERVLHEITDITILMNYALNKQLIYYGVGALRTLKRSKEIELKNINERLLVLRF